MGGPIGDSGAGVSAELSGMEEVVAQNIEGEDGAAEFFDDLGVASVVIGVL